MKSALCTVSLSAVLMAALIGGVFGKSLSAENRQLRLFCGRTMCTEFEKCSNGKCEKVKMCENCQAVTKRCLVEAHKDARCIDVKLCNDLKCNTTTTRCRQWTHKDAECINETKCGTGGPCKPDETCDMGQTCKTREIVTCDDLKCPQSDPCHYELTSKDPIVNGVCLSSAICKLICKANEVCIDDGSTSEACITFN